MAKKMESSNSPAESVAAPAPDKKTKAAAPSVAAVESPAAPAAPAPAKAAPAKGAKKPAATKKPAAKPAAKKTKAAPAFSNDDIALRAYFIAEHRQNHGHHGDSHSDWVEAERQLKAEHKKAKKKA